MRWIAMLVLIVGPAACSASVPAPPPGAAGSDPAIWVISHGWHTGIAVRTADIPTGVWPEHRDLGVAEHVEVGWGDRDFYMAPKGTPGLALRAAFGASGSVLHVVAFDGTVEQFFPGQDVVRVSISREGLGRLAAFVQAAYARDGAGAIVVLGPGQQGRSRFYASRERYFLLQTCNTWTARALREAGLPIAPRFVLTAGGLVNRVRALAGGGPR
jgi:uncharacterized protein (TIGR02117 family)